MISLCGLLLNFVTNPLHGAEADSLFKSDVIINMELRADFSAIQAERSGLAEYHDGELVYYTSPGEPVKLNVKLIVRGHFRRDTANCKFPPLYLTFNKGEDKNTIFKNQNELKLVTPCIYEKDVIDEYLIYKMYNKVTDLSFKVRLAKILYFDTRTQRKLFEKYSFFIEKKEHVAARNNLVVRDMMITPYNLERDNFKKMSIFQYMIGNGDWYFTNNHNFVIMQPKDSTQSPYAVPYDFDLSEFVDAGYARSQNGRRSFKGLCYTAGEFEEVFKFYRELRPEFESVINNMDLISESTRKRKVKYIEYLYTVIESSKLTKREFLDRCETSIDYRIKRE
jgi:hypothetical protein